MSEFDRIEEREMDHGTGRTRFAMNGKIKLTAYHGYVASGSGISDPNANSGYEAGLVAELARIVPGGGTITVTAAGAADLAEWASDLANAIAQEPNPSGARSLTKLAERAYALKRELEVVHEARAAKAHHRYYATCTCGWATSGGRSKADATAAAAVHEREANAKAAAPVS